MSKLLLCSSSSPATSRSSRAERERDGVGRRLKTEEDTAEGGDYTSYFAETDLLSHLSGFRTV